jgi:protoporphyrinogen IX oxidase
VSGTKTGRRAVAALAIFVALAGFLFFVSPDDFYLWAKAIHVIAVISWMAGMLYLPRLFVYHAATAQGSAQSETFKVMEQRLLRLIINPAMILTWVFGVYLAWEGFRLTGGWLHVKIVLVLALSGLHGYFARAVRLFAEDRNVKSERHWRVINEAPAILMMMIVVLVVVKPF